MADVSPSPTLSSTHTGVYERLRAYQKSRRNREEDIRGTGVPGPSSRSSSSSRTSSALPPLYLHACATPPHAYAPAVYRNIRYQWAKNFQDLVTDAERASLSHPSPFYIPPALSEKINRFSRTRWPGGNPLERPAHTQPGDLYRKPPITPL